MIDRLAARYGRRGCWLMLLGAMWLLIGGGTFLDPLAPRPWVLLELAPPWAVAMGWWVTGVLAIFQGRRGVVEDDSLGHVALYVMPMIRVGSYLICTAVYGTTLVLTELGRMDGPVGWSGAWYAALVWSLMPLVLAVVAAWPNPAPLLPKPPATDSTGAAGEQ